MIQRIQTVYLAAIFLLSALLVFLPFREITLGTVHYLLCLAPGCSKEIVKPFIYMPVVINASVGLLSLICIFLYRSRAIQVKLCQVLLALSAVLISYLSVSNFVSLEPGTYAATYKIAIAFPVLNVVLAALARRAIKKDEELVRSADRIR